jgi:uncharacterized protein involved in high-affinity Fe2+ transport
MNSKVLLPLLVGGLAVLGLFFWLSGLAQPGRDQQASPSAAGHAAMTTSADADTGKLHLMPMVAVDGPHYGATVHMPGHGRYRLVYTIHPPDPQQFGRHNDEVTGVAPWFDTFSVEFDFDYQGVPEPNSQEAKRLGNEIKPGFREYPIDPEDGREVNHMLIKAVWLPPVQMEGMLLPQDPDVIHLEADISALKGNPNGFFEGMWIPYLRIDYELIPVERAP